MITKEIVLKYFYYKDGYLYNKIDRAYNCKAGDRVGLNRVRDIYRKFTFKGRCVSEHRLIFLMHHGYLPKYVDHISDILTDEGAKCNKIENLREISNGSNAQKGIPKGGSSKYRGVSELRGTDKFLVTISHNGKSICLGRFLDEIEAAEAYDKRAFEYHGKYAGLNFAEDYTERSK